MERWSKKSNERVKPVERTEEMENLIYDYSCVYTKAVEAGWHLDRNESSVISVNVPERLSLLLSSTSHSVLHWSLRQWSAVDVQVRSDG